MKYIKSFFLTEQSKFIFESVYKDYWQKLINLSNINEELDDYIEISELPLVVSKTTGGNKSQIKRIVNNTYSYINSFSEESINKSLYVNYKVTYDFEIKDYNKLTNDIPVDDSIVILKGYISLMNDVKRICERFKNYIGLSKCDIISNIDSKKITISVYSEELPKDKVREIFEDCKNKMTPITNKLNSIIKDLYKKYEKEGFEKSKFFSIDYNLESFFDNIIPIGTFLEDEIIIIGRYDLSQDSFLFDEDEFKRSLDELKYYITF